MRSRLVSPLTGFRSGRIGRFQKALLLSAVAFGALGLASAEQASAQVWEKPYADGSTADQQLQFDYGSANTVTAPPPAPPYVGIGYSSLPASGSGGGWGLSASGSASVGTNTPPFEPVILATSSARTLTTGTGSMRFDIVNTGLLSDLASVSLPMTWLSQASIIGSETWVAPSNRYIYEFDAFLNNSLLSGNPDIFGDISLTISAGSEILYQGVGLPDILGVTDLLPSNYGVQVGFNYDQSDGPLLIQWSASSTVGAQILGGLGTSDTIYEISAGSIYVDVIPEPGTYALLAGALGVLWMLRRRHFTAGGQG